MSAAQGGVAPAQSLPPTEEELADAENGIYHATPQDIIVCVGDLEGNSLKKLINPDGATPQSNTGVLTATASNLTELYAYLTVDPRGNLILQENVILVYLGDVFGDGPDNIKLARTLLQLKSVKATKVVIINGNRDIIKRRSFHELQPTDECMADLIKRIATKGKPSDFNRFNFEFKYNTESDFDYMWGKSPAEISNKPGCLERVLYIKEETFNEYYGWVFLVDEYLTTIGRSQEIETTSLEHKSYIYVYLVQVMSGVIQCGDAPDFNNIFDEILMKGHLMACIDAGDTHKFGFMHSLPPRGKIPTIPGFIYKEQLDAVKAMKEEDRNKPNNKVSTFKDASITTATEVHINNGLRVFNQYLRTLITDYNTMPNDVNRRRRLLEWVSGMTSGSYWLYTNNPIIGANMPISTVSFGTGFDPFETASGIKIQGGGGIDALSGSIANEYFDINYFTHIVCSHSPKGYVGVKVQTTNNKFYYCIDVSKIDDQEYDVKNRFGCCFLVFDLSKTSKGGSVDDKFIGRIMLQQSQFPKNYDIFTGNIPDPASNDSTPGFKPMYANYVVSSPIPISSRADMEQTLPLKIGNIDYKFEFKTPSKPIKETREIKRLSQKQLDYYTKLPTLKLSDPHQYWLSGYGGSRTRKRRSKYPKKSTRTTHKRRRISKKLNRNKKNKKSKYGARR